MASDEQACDFTLTERERDLVEALRRNEAVQKIGLPPFGKVEIVFKASRAVTTGVNYTGQ